MKHKKLIVLATLFSAGFMLATSQAVKADSVTGTIQVANNSSVRSNTNNTKQHKKDVQDAENTPVKDGWINQNGKRLYLVKNRPVKGLKKIDRAWYLFDKNDAMLTGVRKIPHQNNYGYFEQDGRRQFANTNTNRAYYWINKKGNITGIKNYAKEISQRPEMPTGCEITAVTMMINFAGKNITKDQAARIMPRSLNPNKGFIGSPYKKFPLGFWVAPDGVKPVVKHYLGAATNMTNFSISAINKKLICSHLVVVWVGWFDGFSNHAITLTGYHGSTLYYNDPWTGTKRAMNIETFKRHWKLDGHRALSY